MICSIIGWICCHLSNLSYIQYTSISLSSLAPFSNTSGDTIHSALSKTIPSFFSDITSAISALTTDGLNPSGKNLYASDINEAYLLEPKDTLAIASYSLSTICLDNVWCNVSMYSSL